MASTTFASSSSRPLRLCRRGDLIARRQQYQGRAYYVVKDPIALEYFRFQEEEYFVLEQLDGGTSLDEIKARFERRFPPQKIGVEELGRYVAMLHSSSLVIAEIGGEGRRLAQRQVERKRKKFWGAATNVLSLRLRGINPDGLLDRLNRWAGWFFSLPAMVLSLLFVLAAVVLVAAQFDAFVNRLPEFEEFFAAKNWLLIACVLAATKVLHELGHGLACKRLGGECHEMGIMFLVFTPCLYCNVSDSWLLPNRWHRAAIGAAGMYVEIVLAAIATFVWWFTAPSLLHYLALNVMFVCSVTTLLFNANPLMRYDGYYILSDVLEIPNLRQKATTLLQRKAGSYLLGLEETPDPFLPEKRQWLFVTYAVAAGVYRWLISASILWFLYNVLEPYGLGVFGRLLALMALYGLLIHPLWRLVKFFYVPGRIELVNRRRAGLSAAAICCLLLIVFWLPLPYYVYCSLEVHPSGAASVYVEVPGTLEAVHGVQPGDQVQGGQPLVTLTSLDLDISIEQLVGRREKLAAKLDTIRRLAITSDEAAMQVAEAQEALATIEDQLRRRREDRQRLQVTAPVAGTLLAPPTRAPEPADSGRLPTWSGTPFESRNEGALLEEGALLCRIGDPARLEATLVIDQSQIEFIAPGQQVEIQLDQNPYGTFHGQIMQVSAEQLRVSSTHLAAEGDLATRKDSSGHLRPMSTTYQASVPLDAPAGDVVIGGTGQAKIHAGYRTIGSRIWWALASVFKFGA